MVNEVGVPTQLFAVGVTVTVPEMGVVPGFVPVKDGMFPLPLAAKPMAELLLVQVYVVPVTGLLGTTTVLLAFLHIVWLDMAFTEGEGFTVTV